MSESAKQSSFIVNYPDYPILSATNRELDFVQSGWNDVGYAKHVFSLANAYSEEAVKDVISAIVEDIKELKFQLKDTATGNLGPEYTHYVNDYTLTFALGQNNHANTSLKRMPQHLVIHTVDGKQKMNLEVRNGAHKIETINETLKTIIERNKLIVGDLAAIKVPTEHKILRQVNLTDWQFIAGELLPRASEPCVFFTNDGKTMNLQKVGQGNAYTVNPYDLIAVKESNNVMSSLKHGGVQYGVWGYDDLEKGMIGATAGPEIEPSFGSKELPIEGYRVEHFSLHTQEAMEAWASSRNALAGFSRYSMEVSIRGSVDTQNWKLPMTVDLSECLAYRKNNAQTAAITKVRHMRSQDSNYLVTLICARPNIEL